MLRFDTIEQDGVQQPMALEATDDGDRKGLMATQAQTHIRGDRARTITIATHLLRPPGAGVYVFYNADALVLGKNFRTNVRSGGPGESRSHRDVGSFLHPGDRAS